MPINILIAGILAGLPEAIKLGTAIAGLIEKSKSGTMTDADAAHAVTLMDAAVKEWDDRIGPHA